MKDKPRADSDGQTAPDESLDQAEGPARRLVLAGIGAAASMADAAADRFDEFVNRGRQVRDEWQGKADEVRRRNVSTRGRVQESFRTAMDVFLDSLNIPSKGDMDTINVKLNILSRKLDDLQMERVRGTSAGAAKAPTPPTPPTDQST
jgi:poly(hydroxyalkanoate) granule-associated protein